MTTANALRFGFGAAIALGLLFEQPNAELGAPHVDAAAVIEAVSEGGEAPVVEAAAVRPESCSAHPATKPVETTAVGRLREL